MNILITGGTGFIGSALIKRLLQKGYNLIVLSRSLQDSSSSTKFIKSLSEINHNEKIDVIINLAGAPINKRWSNSYKQELISKSYKSHIRINIYSKTKTISFY